MASFLKNIWDQLGQPLDLVDKGKYGPEKSFKWKFLEIIRDFSGSNDNYFWSLKATKEKDLIFSQIFKGLSSDHQCVPDEQFRCKVCGKILRWGFYGNVKISEPYSIFYYDYSYVEQAEKREGDLLIHNFTEIHHLLIQRDFSLFIFSRQAGFGFSDFKTNKKAIIPKSLGELKTSGDSFPAELEFYGDYESSNLRSVIIDPNTNQYRIVLKSDTNSLGFSQWFNFGIKFYGPKEKEITISIINQRKKRSLFAYGMKPFTGKVQTQGGVTWEMCNQEIIYGQSDYRRKENEFEIDDKQGELFSSLSFKHTFKLPGERVIFSYSKPFTFTDLIDFFDSTESELKKRENSESDFSSKSRTTFIQTDSLIYKREIVGGTRMGLSIYILEITAPKKIRLFLPYSNRKVIVIFARQIPYETPSSLICNGLITFLLSNDPIAAKLREFFIFKIVPMVNPDGVSVGNSRTNISGSDLNSKLFHRCWENPSETMEPEIFHLKSYLNKFKEQKKKDIFMLIDIHASSTKKGAFIVGCEQGHGLSSNGGWISNRLFPKLFQESVPYFDEKKCTFNLRKKNTCTARGIFWSLFKAKYSFVFESSMYGYNPNSFHKNFSNECKEEEQNSKEIDLNQQPKQTTSLNSASDFQTENICKNRDISEPIYAFSVNDFESMGKDICVNLLHFTLMFVFIQEEISKNPSNDLDISRVINFSPTFRGEATNEERSDVSFTGKSAEIELRKRKSTQEKNSPQNNSLKGISKRLSYSQVKYKTTAYMNLLSDSSQIQSDTPMNIRIAQNQQSPKIKNQSDSPFKDVPEKSLLSIKQTITPNKKGSAVFFLKMKNQMIKREVSLMDNSDTGSLVGSEVNSPVEISQDNFLPNSNLKFNFKLNLNSKKMSIEEPLEGIDKRTSSREKNMGSISSKRNDQNSLSSLDADGNQKSCDSSTESKRDSLKATNDGIGLTTPLKIKKKQQDAILILEKSPLYLEKNQNIKKEFEIVNKKNSLLKLQHLTNPSPIRSSKIDFPYLNCTPNGINVSQSRPASRIGSSQSIFRNSYSLNRSGINRRGGGLVVPKKKNSAFVKYLLKHSQAIKQLLPQARSFDWIHYFTAEEIENSIGENGIQSQLLSMLTNMETIIEYDTDSDPEDDFIDSKDTDLAKKSLFCDTYQDEPTERRMKMDEICERFGDKYKSYLRELKIDELQGLIDGFYEIDEEGKLRKKGIRESKSQTVTGRNEGSNFWKNLIGQYKKERGNSESVPPTSNKKQDNKPDSGDTIIGGDWKGIQIPDNDNKKTTSTPRKSSQSEDFSNIDSQRYAKYNWKQPSILQSYSSSGSNNFGRKQGALLPKLELIRLKNPFLPTNQELQAKYNFKSIQSTKQYQNAYNKQNILTLTTFSTKPQLKPSINPLFCMTTTGFFSHKQHQLSSTQTSLKNSFFKQQFSKTENSSNYSPLHSQLDYSDSFSVNSSNQKSSQEMRKSQRSFYKESNSKKSRDISTDPPQQGNLEPQELEQEFILNQFEHKIDGKIKEKILPSNFKIVNSQFGSQVIFPKEKQRSQERQLNARTLVVYLQQQPMSSTKIGSNDLKGYSNQQIIPKQREEGKKTVISFQRKEKTPSRIPSPLLSRLSSENHS